MKTSTALIGMGVVALFAVGGTALVFSSSGAGQPAGQAGVAVPDLRGLTKVEAARLLLASGLEVGEIQYDGKFDNSFVVISHNPAPNFSVTKGSSVSLTLALSQKEIAKRLAKAKAAVAAKASKAKRAGQLSDTNRVREARQRNQWRSLRILGPSVKCSPYGWKFQGVITFEWRNQVNEYPEFRNLDVKIDAPESRCPNGSYLADFGRGTGHGEVCGGVDDYCLRSDFGDFNVKYVGRKGTQLNISWDGGVNTSPEFGLRISKYSFIVLYEDGSTSKEIRAGDGKDETPGVVLP